MKVLKRSPRCFEVGSGAFFFARNRWLSVLFVAILYQLKTKFFRFFLFLSLFLCIFAPEIIRFRF